MTIPNTDETGTQPVGALRASDFWLLARTSTSQQTRRCVAHLDDVVVVKNLEHPGRLSASLQDCGFPVGAWCASNGDWTPFCTMYLRIDPFTVKGHNQKGGVQQNNQKGGEQNAAIIYT